MFSFALLWTVWPWLVTVAVPSYQTIGKGD